VSDAVRLVLAVVEPAIGVASSAHRSLSSCRSWLAPFFHVLSLVPIGESENPACAGNPATPASSPAQASTLDHMPSLVTQIDATQRVPLSGRIAVPRGEPRGLLVCVHGGGMTSGYFDSATHVELSVLQQFAVAGFAALAPDRPGYGATPAGGGDLAAQAAWLAEAMEAMSQPGWHGLPVVLVGHSFGSMVCTAAVGLSTVAAVGLSMSGVGVKYSQANGTNPVADSQETSLTGLRDLTEMWWGAPELYPAGALSPRSLPTARIASEDRAAAAQWPLIAPKLAATCEVPVHLLLGDRERWWTSGRSGLTETAAIFSSAPWVQLDEQRFSAHNTALGWTSRGYAHRVLAFVEDCLAGQQIQNGASTQPA
jgi:pimeloyl-ACP methyl ester carboxylesterase